MTDRLAKNVDTTIYFRCKMKFSESVFVVAVCFLALSLADSEEVALNKNRMVAIHHGEKLAELYYQNQLQERTRTQNYTGYVHLNPNYPCIHGANPIGSASEASIFDGHKFACGVHRIKSSPIVYSFGSNQQQDFEESILAYRPDSRIFTFDIAESHLPENAHRNPKITYTATGLGPANDIAGMPKMMLIRELMKQHGHTYIDVLKVDIEGGEYPWIAAEPLDTFDRIGQLMIEVHNFDSGNDRSYCVMTFRQL